MGRRRRQTGFTVAVVAALLCHAAAAGEQAAKSDEQVAKSGEQVAKSDEQAAKSDEQALRKRVTAYWDARVERSQSVYDFYPSPALGGPKNRKLIGEFGNVRFESYRIEDIALEGDSATVRLKVNVHVTPLTQRYELPSKDTWNRICGTWYRKPVRRGLAKREFDPSELGPVGEGGPDCAQAASDPQRGAGAVPAMAKEKGRD
jgi:hypothetical protein